MAVVVVVEQLMPWSCLTALFVQSEVLRCAGVMGVLRRLQRESEASPSVFVLERGSPFTTADFARMLDRAAAAAGLVIKVHPHMLQYGCRYALASKGPRDTRIARTLLDRVDTALTPNRFKNFWRE
jgi:integrase